MHQGRIFSPRLVFSPASSCSRALPGLQWGTFTEEHSQRPQGPGREAVGSGSDGDMGKDTDIVQGGAKSHGLAEEGLPGRQEDSGQ